MKVSEIVAKVAMKAGMKPSDLTKAVDDVFAGIKTAIEQGEKVSIAGLGTFVQRSREAGEKTKSKTGEKVVVGAATFIAFKPIK